jgi:hypothetical protein
VPPARAVGMIASSQITTSSVPWLDSAGVEFSMTAMTGAP